MSSFVAWGLTGGIASGKSSAAKFFAEAGIPVLDADQVSRSLTAPGGAAYDSIVQRFGTADRARLREIVFNDPQARKDLEAILHPLIREASMREMEQLARAAGGSDSHPVPVVYEATLLVETGRYRDFAGLIVVEAPKEDRIARLITRDGSNREMAEKILAAQVSDEARRVAATHVIVNDSDLSKLRSQVQALAAKLKS